MHHFLHTIRYIRQRKPKLHTLLWLLQHTGHIETNRHTSTTAIHTPAKHTPRYHPTAPWTPISNQRLPHNFFPLAAHQQPSQNAFPSHTGQLTPILPQRSLSDRNHHRHIAATPTRNVTNSTYLPVCADTLSAAYAFQWLTTKLFSW